MRRDAQHSAGPDGAGARADARGDPAPAAPPASRPAWRLGDRPELWSLRAPLAVAVLAAHNIPAWDRGEWCSLDVFFVLSGFLITTILLSEQAARGRFSLRRFYSRRALRLLPPLLVVILFVVVYGLAAHVEDFRDRVVGDVTSTLLMTMDYRLALGREPFGGFLPHCWSLAVEEQFYVLWALLLLAATRVRWRWAPLVIAAVGLVASTVDRLLLYHGVADDARVFYAFDTRADSIAFGCVLGVLAVNGLFTDPGAAARRALAAVAALCVAGLLVMLVAFPLTSPFTYRYGLTLASVATVGLLAHLLASPGGRLAHVLRNRALVHVGLLTYGLYLWHIPIFIILSPSGMNPFALFALRLAVVVPVAELSWFAIEKRFMALRRSPRFAARTEPAGARSAP